METYIKEALFILFQFCFIAQIYFLVSNQNVLNGFKTPGDLPPSNNPVSVIISARNEAGNLRANLPVILEQDYPDFEVVVINDCSFDQSDTVLTELQATYPRLKVVTITEHARFKTGKKFALTLGIKAAANEQLLFTDADCLPASDKWIACMAAHFKETKQIVLGYSPYNKTANWLNSFIRFETIKTAVNYLSAALNGNAYMGIGRNLAYTKTLFFNSKGFASHMHVLSGDDDLFVNQNATNTNTAIEIHPGSFMYTDAKASIAALFRQKKRHFGVGTLYKAKHRRALSIDAVSGFLFYVLLILCLIFDFEPWLALGMFMFRLIFQLIIYNKLFKRLDGTDLLWYMPVFDIIYYLYINIFGVIGALTKSTKWK